MSSSRKSNFFKAPKHDWRVRNLQFLIDYGQSIWVKKPFRIGAKGVLHPCVVELIGESGFLSFDLFKAYLPDPLKDFIGFEEKSDAAKEIYDQGLGQSKHEEVREKYPFLNSPEYLFQFRKMDLARYLRYPERPVSVINWDGTKCIGNRRWWETDGYERRFASVLRQHSGPLGEVAFILNLSLAVPKETREKRVANLELFRAKLARIFQVRPELIIADTAVAGSESPTGIYNSLDFYRSESTPMVTFRAIYDARGHHRLYGT